MDRCTPVSSSSSPSAELPISEIRVAEAVNEISLVAVCSVNVISFTDASNECTLSSAERDEGEMTTDSRP